MKNKTKFLCKKDCGSYFLKGKIYDAEGPIDRTYLFNGENEHSIVFNLNENESFYDSPFKLRMSEYFCTEKQTLRYLKIQKINQ